MRRVSLGSASTSLLLWRSSSVLRVSSGGGRTSWERREHGIHDEAGSSATAKHRWLRPMEGGDRHFARGGGSGTADSALHRQFDPLPVHHGGDLCAVRDEHECPLRMDGRVLYRSGRSSWG